MLEDREICCHDGYMDGSALYDFLKQLEIVESDVLDSVWQESQETHIPLEDLLAQKELVADDSLGRIVADFRKQSYVQLSKLDIQENTLEIVPEMLARRRNIIAFLEDAAGLHVATSRSDNSVVFEQLFKKTGLPVIVHYATTKDIEDTLHHYAEGIEHTLQKMIAEDIERSLHEPDYDVSIIQLVDTIISYAAHDRASDIHFEPEQDRAVIRFRIDGLLQQVALLPQDMYERVVIRVKVMASIRTDEHFAAQDGKIRYEKDMASYDIRVSIVPITYGEKIVMRLLSDLTRQLSLQDLGYSSEDLTFLTEIANKPHGMILSTGPTGSGKTTTMYGILKLLNKEDVNIMTIEDPVEYELPRVNQIQVNAKTGLTFAAGLKSIVRQDPDIILVGEIRDQETADIAVNSAMTGHMVLSTLHTNDAASALPRLMEMDVEPFLISSTVSVIIGQRLVRQICAACRVSYDFDTERVLTGTVSLESDTDELQMLSTVSTDLIARVFGSKKIWHMYKGKGCEVCHQTGYTGRIGIFELLTVSGTIQELITTKASAEQIKQMAMSEGMKTMLEDGFEKAKQGLTTLDEVLRVTME